MSSIKDIESFINQYPSAFLNYWKTVKSKLKERNVIKEQSLNDLDTLLSQGCYPFYECLLYYMKTENIEGLEMILNVLLSLKPEELSTQSLLKQEETMFKFPSTHNSSDDIEILKHFGMDKLSNEEQIEIIWKEIGTWSV